MKLGMPKTDGYTATRIVYELIDSEDLLSVGSDYLRFSPDSPATSRQSLADLAKVAPVMSELVKLLLDKAVELKISSVIVGSSYLKIMIDDNIQSVTVDHVLNLVHSFKASL